MAAATASKIIYERSGGVPRVINRLCDRALHAAFGRRAATIDRNFVEPADRDDAAPPRAPVVAPVLAPVMAPPAPVAKTADPVEAWLNSIEDPAARSANPQVRIGHAPANRTQAVPTTAPRKWTRRLELLAFSLVVLLVALMIAEQFLGR